MRVDNKVIRFDVDSIIVVTESLKNYHIDNKAIIKFDVDSIIVATESLKKYHGINAGRTK